MINNQSLQDLWPLNTCYGCGPSNLDGMHLKSYWSADQKYVSAMYSCEAKYNAGYPGVMFGGTVASLIDCQSIWTAIAFAHKAENRQIESTSDILYVTKQITVNYISGTPLEEHLYLKSWIEGNIEKKVTVICELGTKDKLTATGKTIAVRIG
jgi:hypothetical protein